MPLPLPSLNAVLEVMPVSATVSPMLLAKVKVPLPDKVNTCAPLMLLLIFKASVPVKVPMLALLLKSIAPL